MQWKLLSIAGLLLAIVSLGCALLPSPEMAVLLFAMLAIVVMAFRYPPLALLLLGASTSFPSLVLPLAGHNMHLVEPVTLLCLLVMVVQRPPTRVALPHLLTLAFMLIALLSFIHVPGHAGDPNSYAPEKPLLTLAFVCSAFFCSSSLSWYVRNPGGLLIAMLLACIPLYLVGLAQAIGIHLPIQLEAIGSNNPRVTLGRLWGTFPWSTNFGMYLINPCAVALACWLLATRRRERVIGLVMLVATLLEIVGSGTRSAAIAALVALALACVITRRFKLFFCMLTLTAINCATFFTTIGQLFTHDATSTTNRLLLWNEAIKLIEAHPWLGIGLQQFPVYYAQLIVSQASELGPQGIHPHEQYLEWAMESGILWLFVGILLLASILFTCWQVYHMAERKQQVVLLAAILAVTANCIIGFFDAPLDQLEGSVFLFMLAGLATGYATRVHALEAAPAERSSIPSTHQAGTKRGAAPTRISTRILDTSMGTLHPLTNNTESAPTIQKTGSSIVLQLLAWGIAIPVIFPTTALLTRYLGPVRYGEYNLTFPFLTIFALLSGTGMDPLIIRQLSRQPRATWQHVLSYAAGTRCVATLLSIGLSALVACVLPLSDEQRSLFLLGGITLFFSFSFNGLRIIYSHGFRAEQRVGILSLLETTNRLLTTGLVALAVLLHLSLVWTYILLAYSDLPTFILLVLSARRRFGVRMRFSWQNFREHMLSGLPLLGHDVLTLAAAQIDLLVLLLVAGPVSVGIYSLASRATDPLIAIAHAYVNGFYPLLCKKFESGRAQFAETYTKGMRILALGIIPLAVLVSMQADTIVALLGGSAFASAATAVQLLMWAMVATFLNRMGQQACTAANMERRTLLVTSITAITNLLLNLLLIPYWQITGAGIAAVASECIGVCAFAISLRQHIRLYPTFGMLLLVVAANVPAWAFLYWQRASPPLLTIPLALLLTIACYISTRLLSRRDIAAVKDMLSSKRIGKEHTTNGQGTLTNAQALSQRMTDEPTLILPRIQV